MKKQLIAHIAQKLKSYGYTVYLSKDGRYGFYTDGIKVVSFGGHWNWCVDFSGNYITDQPRQTGTGWQVSNGKELSDIDEVQAKAFISASAPQWAVGSAKVKYTTPEQYLKTYGSSSGFVEFTEAMRAAEGSN